VRSGMCVAFSKAASRNGKPRGCGGIAELGPTVTVAVNIIFFRRFYSRPHGSRHRGPDISTDLSSFQVCEEPVKSTPALVGFGGSR